MIESRQLQIATFVGTVLQIAMVVIGHFVPWVALHVFMFGGMMISATVGYLYARDVGKGYGDGALGGAIAGGVCALLGIAVSVVLGDTQPAILALGTSISVLTGAIGGLFGQMSAAILAWGRRKSGLR
jgi:hypothetical protein